VDRKDRLTKMSHNERINPVEQPQAESGKQTLLTLKQTPDEGSLYYLQLAECTLKHNLEDQDGRLTEMFKQAIPALKPQEAMRW